MNVTRTILVADDQEIERAALRDVLRAEPTWEIVEAKDGDEAMELLCQGRRPDVCLLDLRMPKLDGVQVLQRMRRDPLLRDIKVVVTSATRDKETILALAKLKISGYLLKPYDSVKILATLRPVLAPSMADPSLSSKNLLSKTALIVDDNSTERTALFEFFKAEDGWDVLQAQDGVDALDRLNNGLRPDLLLVDLLMPRLDGFTFIQRLREDAVLRNLRVVVTSAEHDRDKVRALAQLNIAGYLLKPIDTAKIRAILRQGAAGLDEARADEREELPTRSPGSLL